MHSSFKEDLKKAFFILWLATSILSFIAIISVVFINEDLIYGFSSILESPHESTCMMCGMTESCISISNGDISHAYKTNQMSIPLFSILAVNWIVFFTFTISKIKKKNKK